MTYESAAVIESCLASLAAAAPRRGLEIVVVDNASSDGSADLAVARLGADRVRRLPVNRGFAAGVNAGFAGCEGPWIAVVNPDVIVPAGALDALADILERHPRAGVVGPRVRDERGRLERTVGRFPTFSRECVHALRLDRLPGLEGRHPAPPAHSTEVDWVSGCAWMLRAAAVWGVGPLDEGYFMYCEDVDYCRRTRDAGWVVLAVPGIEVRHALGQGSRDTGLLPADGGVALLRYFAKFHPQVRPGALRAVLAGGWRLRRAWHRLRASLGDSRSAALAKRYQSAIDALGRRQSAD